MALVGKSSSCLGAKIQAGTLLATGTSDALSRSGRAAVRHGPVRPDHRGVKPLFPARGHARQPVHAWAFVRPFAGLQTPVDRPRRHARAQRLLARDQPVLRFEESFQLAHLPPPSALRRIVRRGSDTAEERGWRSSPTPGSLPRRAQSRTRRLRFCCPGSALESNFAAFTRSNRRHAEVFHGAGFRAAAADAGAATTPPAPGEQCGQLALEVASFR